MKTTIGKLKRVIREAVKGDLTAEVRYDMYGASATLSDGRQLELTSLAEDLVPYEEYLGDDDSKDEAWNFFSQHVAQEVLEAAGVTMVDDTESDEGPVTIVAYRDMLYPIPPDLQERLAASKDAIAKFAQDGVLPGDSDEGPTFDDDHEVLDGDMERDEDDEGEPDECEGCGVSGPLEFVETPGTDGAGDWVCPSCAERLAMP